ncbi:MAG: hypothetical protein WD226_01660 [Planctomycetota bacterium]
MRSTLATAVVALVLVLAARAWHAVTERAAERGPTGCFIEVISRGPLLPRSSELSPRDQVEAAILAGDRLLAPTEGAEGLLVRAFGADGRPAAGRSLAPSADPDDVLRFAEQVPVGGFLALAHLGRWTTAPRAFAAVVEALGGDAPPERGSWALVAVRDAAGWRAVHAARSTTSGVAIATHLPTARRLAPVVETERLAGLGAVNLTHERPDSTVAHVRHAAEVGGAPLAAWAAPVHGGAFEPVLVFDDLPLGAEARLTLGLALRTLGRNAGQTAEVRATIARPDGSSKSWTRAVPARDRWSPVRIDLAAFAGHRVRLLVEARLDADSEPAELLIGLPTLVYHGFDR